MLLLVNLQNNIIVLLLVNLQNKKIYKRNIEARSLNHSFSGKTMSITYSECVYVALGVQLAMRMRRIMLSSVACLAVHCFSTLSHKRRSFPQQGY